MVPTVITPYSTHLERKTTLPLTSVFNLVDLLEFKRNNDLPSWYPIFQIPYCIELKVSYTETIALVQLIYIDTSTDPEFFAICITRSHMTNFSHTYIVVTMTRTSPIII